MGWKLSQLVRRRSVLIPAFFVSPRILGGKFALLILSSYLLWSRISTAARISVASTCLCVMRDFRRSSEPANF
jgi:hypothetical protein